MTARAKASPDAPAPTPAPSAHRLARLAEERARVEAIADAEDQAAMRRFLAGDPRGFAEISRRHEKGLYNFVLRMLKSAPAAEDGTQEILLRVVRSADQWRPGSRVKTWMYVIARNHCIDELRKARHRETESLDRPFYEEDGTGGTLGERLADERLLRPDRLAESGRMRERLVRAIDALPNEQREVFLMREHAGLSFKEIAEITGVAENTAKSRMRYALQGLRASLAREGVSAEDAKP